MAESRLDFPTTHPQAFSALMSFQNFVDKSGIDKTLARLIKIRASQINGCAYCLDMHLEEARIAGIGNQRLNTLQAWREVELFSVKERAVLAWTEALTHLEKVISVPNPVYKAMKDEFSDEEIVLISSAIVAVNSWNRMCIAFRSQPPQRSE